MSVKESEEREPCRGFISQVSLDLNPIMSNLSINHSILKISGINLISNQLKNRLMNPSVRPLEEACDEDREPREDEDDMERVEADRTCNIKISSVPGFNETIFCYKILFYRHP